MRILVVGSGAREHALVWKVLSSPNVSAVYAAPGNVGTSFFARRAPVATNDIEGQVAFARENRIDLTVVGPEGPLAAGIVDAFHRAGLRIFGPTQAAARIESSKLWAKDLMQRYEIPTAHWRAAASPDEARSALATFGQPVVLKADGLAGGHGAVVCHSREEAEGVIDDLMVKKIHGESGERIVIEEFLEGRELSVFALTDGSHVLPLIPARDYKPLLDGDLGPNTGGMGGYARPSYATPDLLQRVQREILEPAVRAMASEGAPYVGVLYAGLMITPDGPRVLEFNCRWGDPEAQLLLPLLKSDLVELMLACLDGQLDQTSVEWHQGTSVGVVLASAGYPTEPVKGQPITGLDRADEGVLIFHAATRLAPQEAPRGTWFWQKPAVPAQDAVPLLTDGGRVLTIVAIGPTLAEARARAYANVERVHFPGMHYRRDLGADDQAGPRPRGRAGQAGPGPRGEIRAGGPLLAAGPAGPTPGAEQLVSAPPLAPGPAWPVAILMGSESDRSMMEETARVLETLGISHELHVMSAHRTPEHVRQFARSAEARGVRVIIAGAGGAAHLPGVIASQTTLPVIGVPIPGSNLMGLDSLLSIVQMPAGVPVASVAVGTAGARNAAYLAAAMLGLADEEIRARYKRFRVEQSQGDLEGDS